MISPVQRIVAKGFWILFLLFCVIARFIINTRFQLTPARVAGDVLVGLAWIVLALGTGAFIMEDSRFIEWNNLKPAVTDNTLKSMIKLGHPFFKLEIRLTYFFMVFVYYSTLWCVKGAFVALYFDIFARTVELKRKYWRWLYALAAWISATYVFLILYHTLLCRPISENWAMLPKCSFLRSNIALDISLASNVLTDLPVMALPLAIIKSLRLSRRQKLGFAFVFMLGVLTVTISTVRFTQIQLYKKLNKLSRNPVEDYSNRTINLEIWSLSEMWTALFAVCLPAFRVYLRGRRADRRMARDASASDSSRGVFGGRAGLGSLRSDKAWDCYEKKRTSSETPVFIP